MCQGDLKCLAATHGQPGHGAVFAIRQRPVSGVDGRNQIVDHNLFKCV